MKTYLRLGRTAVVAVTLLACSGQPSVPSGSQSPPPSATAQPTPSAAVTPLPPVNGLIAFDRNGGEALFTIRPDGTDERKLFDSHCCPDWTKDGRLISPALTEAGTFTFATFDADGANEKVMPNDDPTLNLGCDTWSPDAQRVLCAGWDDADPSRNGVYTRRASDGGDARLVVALPDGSQMAGGDFSPDGKQVVFVRSKAAGSTTTAVFVVGIDGSGLKQITGWGMAGCCNASWSPDGSTILFDAHDRLYLVSPDGTDLRRIELPVEGGYSAYEPAWSPDGTRLVFSLFQPPISDSLFTVAPDGSDLFQVTADDGQQEGQPEWGSYLP